jgi:hypothetical protein
MNISEMSSNVDAVRDVTVLHTERIESIPQTVSFREKKVSNFNFHYNREIKKNEYTHECRHDCGIRRKKRREASARIALIYSRCSLPPALLVHDLFRVIQSEFISASPHPDALPELHEQQAGLALELAARDLHA